MCLCSKRTKTVNLTLLLLLLLLLPLQMHTSLCKHPVDGIPMTKISECCFSCAHAIHIPHTVSHNHANLKTRFVYYFGLRTLQHYVHTHYTYWYHRCSCCGCGCGCCYLSIFPSSSTFLSFVPNSILYNSIFTQSKCFACLYIRRVNRM